MAVLWLSIVSFADFSAAGKQPAEYPDPGLIQVVDKNKRVYWGAAPQGLECWPRAYGRHALGAWLRGQSNPPVKGLLSSEPTSSAFLPLLEE